MPEPLSNRPVVRLPTSTSSPLPVPAIRDRVIRAAVSEGLIRSSEIGAFWTEFEELPAKGRPRFWRFVADRHGADREQFYSLAAATYGFSEVEISVSDLIRFIQEVRSIFSEDAWKRMNELRILPIGHEVKGSAGSDSEEIRMIFASADPTRLEVNNYLSVLPVASFVLRYTSASSIDYVLDRVLPVIFSRGKPRGSGGGARLQPLDPIRSCVDSRESGFRRAA